MSTEWIIRNVLVGVILLFLLYLILRKRQVRALNWAMFYSTLWVLVTLISANWMCVKLGFWQFTEPNILPFYIPHDLLFIWVIFWGTIPTLVLKGTRIWIAAFAMLWVDILYMPQLESFGILSLGENWLVGELFLILFVFIPGQYWSKFSLAKKKHEVRSVFQFTCVALIYCFNIPLIALMFSIEQINFNGWYIPYILQLGFIIVLPSIIALIDLAQKGGGTPFPYDATDKLVRTGIYSYIRNPIQWSLTLIFIPLAILYNSPILLIGVLVSFAYTIGSYYHGSGDDITE